MNHIPTNPATQQALTELVHRAKEQMDWEEGFRQRYQKQLKSIEFVRETMCTDITIQAHEEYAAAFRLVAEALQIKL